MNPMVSVITATIPGRERLLAECRASVWAQTFRDFEHVIELDANRDGCSAVVNRAVTGASGEWLFLIADDDLLLPGCLETHLAHADDADIVYAPPLIWGLDVDPWWFFQAPPAIPATALIRRSTWDALGGYDETAAREEDRKMWVRAVDSGCRFVRAETDPTWVYRFHGANKSMAGQPVAVAA